MNNAASRRASASPPSAPPCRRRGTIYRAPATPSLSLPQRGRGSDAAALRELFRRRERGWAAFHAWERTQPPPGAELSVERLLRCCGEAWRLARAAGTIPREPEIDRAKVRWIMQFHRQMRRAAEKQP